MSLRQQNKIRARGRIVEAAEALIEEQGLETTTTRQIAERAGVSYQTLYNYFPTKTLIVRAILETELAQWSSEVELRVKQYDGDLIETLVDVTRIGVNLLAGRQRVLWEALVSQIFVLSQDDNTDVEALSNVAHEHFYALLHQAQGMGHLVRDVDLHLLAHTLFCLTDYAAMYFLLSRLSVEQHLKTQREQFTLVISPYLSDLHDSRTLNAP